MLDKINLEKEKLIKEKKIKKSDLQDSIIYKDNSDNCYYEKFKDGRVEKIDNELNNQKSLDYKRLHEVVYFDKKFK
ncbi:hypothetical protein JIY74_33190, partial [Vibrio harveyi]|nr:hypothetical protein [Vibrio harveyi]